ncbi:MAG TPA: MoaD/ThiS family protein [Candidatus Acidoferrum sp.]|nr:MoaD/ThiS family protein [Candidatus Acidoferrum sp.]
MSVTFHIPGPLRDFSQQRGEIQLSGSPATLLDALQLLWTQHPGLRDRILNEQGQVREHINIFVGNESIRYTGGLETPLSPSATISIIPAISGGAPSPGFRVRPASGASYVTSLNNSKIAVGTSL